MRRFWARWIIVMALTFSVGAHWALIQSLAWVGMTVSYAKQGSFVVALTKALDGQHPCEICKFVQQGQKSERQKEFHSLDTKLDLLFQGGVTELSIPHVAPFEYLVSLPWTVRGDSPPSPPPRFA